MSYGAKMALRNYEENQSIIKNSYEVLVIEEKVN